MQIIIWLLKIILFLKLTKKKTIFTKIRKLKYKNMLICVKEIYNGIINGYLTYNF